MAVDSAPNPIDDYMAGFPPETRTVLEAMRALVRSVVPDASEVIAYAIPTFDLGGKHLLHFAGFTKHVGFYPGVSTITAFEAELRPYKSAKAFGQGVKRLGGCMVDYRRALAAVPRAGQS